MELITNWEATGLRSGKRVDRMLRWLTIFCDSCQPWARLRSARCPSGFSSPLCAEALSRVAGWAQTLCWDLKVSERGSARSADAPVQRKLVDTALCFPLGLNQIRKSGLNSVLSLLSSGSTCFLTLDIFSAQGQSPAHELSWPWNPAHRCVRDPSLCFLSLPTSSAEDSLHVQPLCGHTIAYHAAKLVFLFNSHSNLGNGNVGVSLLKLMS